MVILNAIMFIAYWGLIAVNPELLLTPEIKRLISWELNTLIHLINPILPLLDLLLISHRVSESITSDILLQISYNGIYQGIQ